MLNSSHHSIRFILFNYKALMLPNGKIVFGLEEKMGLDLQKAQLGSLFQCITGILTEPTDMQRLQVNWGQEIEAILNWSEYNTVW